MPIYQFVAAGRSNKHITGLLTADSPRTARDELRQRGLIVVEIVEKTGTERRLFQWGSWDIFSRAAAHDTQVLRDLSTLLSAGIQLSKALDALIQQLPPASRQRWMHVNERLASGGSFASALSSPEVQMDEVVVKMVEAGEVAGDLDRVLSQIAEFRERSARLTDRVGTALMYPALVTLAAIGVAIFVMTNVVPPLIQNLVEAGQKLPFPTRVLQTVSHLLVDYGLWTLAIVVCCGLAGSFLWRSPNVRFAVQRQILSIPLLGETIRRQAISRFAFVSSALLRSGVELIHAFEVSAATMNNLPLQRAIRECVESVRQGRDLGPALDGTKMFPAVAVQVFSVGQESGELEKLLERLAIDYDRYVETMTTRLTSLLEPILIVTLAIVVGFIMFATVLPILEAGNALTN